MSGKKSVRTSPILFEKPPKKAAIIQVSELDSEHTDVSNGSSADSEAKFPLDKKAKDGSIGSVVLKLVVSAISGIFFGIAMEKSRGLYRFSFFCFDLLKDRGSCGIFF